MKKPFLRFFVALLVASHSFEVWADEKDGVVTGVLSTVGVGLLLEQEGVIAGFGTFEILGLVGVVGAALTTTGYLMHLYSKGQREKQRALQEDSNKFLATGQETELFAASYRDYEDYFALESATKGEVIPVPDRAVYALVMTKAISN